MSDLPFTIILSDYALQKLDADLCVLLESVQGDIKQVILDFAGQEVTPESTFRLEEKLEASARESMRIVMQFALNQLEGDDPAGTTGGGGRPTSSGNRAHKLEFS